MIKAVLFDIGDVLIDIDWQRGYKKLYGQMRDADQRLLTLEEITEKLHPGPYGSIWDDFGQNKITQEQFIAEVKNRTDYKGDERLLQSALTEIFEPLEHRIVLLNEMKENKKLQIALVSDTNGMHMDYIESYIPAIFDGIPIHHRFYSHRVGKMKKFGHEFYQHALDTLGVIPANALMIDDRLQNKHGAEKIGLNFLHIEKDEDLKAALSSYSL